MLTYCKSIVKKAHIKYVLGSHVIKKSFSLVSQSVTTLVIRPKLVEAVRKALENHRHDRSRVYEIRFAVGTYVNYCSKHH
jgi:hypothetical protein